MACASLIFTNIYIYANIYIPNISSMCMYSIAGAAWFSNKGPGNDMLGADV